MTVLPAITADYVNRLDKMVQKFVWNGRKSKIAMKTLKCNVSDGGMGLVDFSKKDDSLKVSWIKILDTDQFLANLAYRKLSPTLRENIWTCNIDVRHIKKMFPTSFWRDVLIAWSKINHHEVNTVQQMISQTIWLNSNLKIKGSPYIIPKLVKEGLMEISQLCDEQGKFLDVDTLARWYNTNVMTINSIIASIPKKWKRMIEQTGITTVMQNNYEKYKNVKKISAVYYKLTNVNNEIMYNSYERWVKNTKLVMEFEEFEKAMGDIYKITTHPKLRSFQYRLLNSAVVLKTQLKKWKITNNDHCDFCKESVEDYVHLFWECKQTKKIWEALDQYIRQKDHTVKLKWSKKSILLNNVCETPHHFSNFIVVVAKCLIYSKKCTTQRIVANEVTAYIDKCQRFEMYYAIVNNKIEKHCKKWFIQNEAVTMYNGTNLEQEYVIDYLRNIHTSH